MTGAAGFIGSNLAERLATAGWRVRGLDVVSPYYDVAQKRHNLTDLATQRSFEFVEGDLLDVDLEALLEDVDVVFHQAGQPGIRKSWDDFDAYLVSNVAATRRLLDAAVSTQIGRLVYASSSSVYGDADVYPTSETATPRPHSPYGVTKLAGEHLVGAYARNWGLSTIALRYFTVYGPRQRPDMAMHRIIEACLNGTSFPLFGDGSQIRDFTYVDDVVEANVAAATSEVEPGTVVNVAGGDSTTLANVIAIVERLLGCEVELDRRSVQAGDVHRTGGATELARTLLGWSPSVTVEEGLGRQVKWHTARR